MKSIFKNLIANILKLESRLVIFKYKPKIIAVTGSVGKTSTKDAVFAVLSPLSYVRKSEKSYNSEIGLPLTILGIPNAWNNPFAWIANIFQGLWLFIWPHKYPKWLVLEVGVGQPGDMRRTAAWLKTDAVVITAIGETPAHIEFFNSRKNLIEEKASLIKTLKKDGLLVLNADDPDVLNMKEETRNLTFTYGFNQGANVLASSMDILYKRKDSPGEVGLPAQAGEPVGVIYRIDVADKSLPVMIEGVFGKNHVYASLAALTLSLGLKFNMVNAIGALKNYEISPGRMRLLQGINDSLIIDDTYNSSPTASLSALRTLGEVKTDRLPAQAGRKIAVLGDMLQLGRHTEEAHKNIGQAVKEYCDVLVVVGQRALAIKVGAVEAGMNPQDIFDFSDSKVAGEFLKTFVSKNDMVLVKGSQGMRMEKAVETILEDKANKNNLLVRQDKEWLKRS